jgi:hypothetical protein
MNEKKIRVSKVFIYLRIAYTVGAINLLNLIKSIILILKAER